MTSKLRKGDLQVLEVTEHSESNKKFAIFGQFKGSRKKIILARIGEGDTDPRHPDIIRMTAEGIAKEIRGLYATMAHVRAMEIAKTGVDPYEQQV